MALQRWWSTCVIIIYAALCDELAAYRIDGLLLMIMVLFISKISLDWH